MSLFTIPFRTAKAKPGMDKDVVKKLPRPKRILSSKLTEEVRIPTIQQLDFKTSPAKVVLRVLKWYYAFSYFFLRTVVDRILRRDTTQRQAERLRETFEWIGGTFLKIGQQMSMRVDLLPFEYCNELAKMLDTIRPFPFEEAAEVIERATGKPLRETFQAIDPEPIGSASLACVYRAVLLDGSVVAVKVRRPGIGEKFMADCQAMEWVVRTMEFLTVSRPGYSLNIVRDLRSVLLEELDFRRERRYMDVFRRKIKKNRQRYVRVPEAHYKLSNEEMLVSEFVEGISMAQVIATFERKDEKGLAILREKGIRAKTLARRMLKFWNFSVQVSGIFHGDPHPANIIVQPGGKLVFIDFGSCGYFTKKDRWCTEQIAHYQALGDIEALGDVGIHQVEPLPHINVDEYKRKYMGMLWYNLLAFEAKNYEWFERTSMPMYLALLEVNKEYDFPVNLDLLRLLRASMLNDAVVGRLYPMNIYREARRFASENGKIRRRRMKKRMKRMKKKKQQENLYMQALDSGLTLGQDIKNYLEILLRNKPKNYTTLIDKGAAAASLGFGMVLSVGLVTTLLTLGLTAYGNFIENNSQTFTESFVQLTGNKWYLGYLAGTVLLNIRRLLFRLKDLKVES